MPIRAVESVVADLEAIDSTVDVTWVAHAKKDPHA